MAVFENHTWASKETITLALIQAINDGIYDTHYANGGAHNHLYRGKSLGSSITSTQAGYISAGTFTDLFIGDYWTISSVNYDFAGCNYIYNAGSTSRISAYHAAIVPRSRLYTAPMNTSNTTEGGYSSSAMFLGDSYTVSSTEYTGLTNAESTIKAAFGDYVMTYEEYFVNATTDGFPTGSAWIGDRVCDLMNESMVYGGAIRQQTSYGGIAAYNGTIMKSQLPLFALCPNRANIGVNWWLRDVVSTTNFACVGSSGGAHGGNASSVNGVRPCFFIT